MGRSSAGASGGAGRSSGGSGGGGGGGALTERQQSQISYMESRIAKDQKLIASAQRTLDRQSVGGAVRRLRPETLRDYRNTIRQAERRINEDKATITKIRSGK